MGRTYKDRRTEFTKKTNKGNRKQMIRHKEEKDFRNHKRNDFRGAIDLMHEDEYLDASLADLASEFPQYEEYA
jgi:hypothetical protein